MKSPVPSIQQVTQDRLRSCMSAMKEISRVWLVGKMVYALFESIMGNKVLEERLQRAEGKRHRNLRQSLSHLEQQQSRQAEATKRKYDDMAIDFSTTTPQPQESYERSRPQTPSAVKTEPMSSMQPPPVTSPNSRHTTADTFMGGTNSRPQTRPATPFNPSFSVPPTPPDLYLVTRNSPNLSQSLWENFQPDQLFPDSASMPAFPNLSPTQTHSNLDHNNMGSMPSGNGQSGMHNPQAGQYQQRGNGMMPQGFQSHGNMWQQPNLDPNLPEGQSPDSWSTASGPGQAVPTTLNVEDWFQFFGINGTDPNHINLDMPLG
jgi:hypothetical protein